MEIVDIQAAINSIPAKKEDLRKAFEDLESYSSSFTSFTLQWRDIDDQISSIEKFIDKSFRELKAKPVPEKPTAPVSAANAKVDQDRPVIEPRTDLKYHCVKMDAMGLKSYIIDRKNTEAVRRELGPALLCSPDPVTLVLDSFEGFVSSSGKTQSENQTIRKTYLIILECFHGLKLEVKHSDKERARQVAKDCYDLIKDWKNNHDRQIIYNSERKKNRHVVLIMVFLRLIVTFGLLEYFAIGDILDVLVTVASKKNIVDLCRHSALEEKLPDLINKLNKDRRQLDSVKFVLAFNLQQKFPPASLFEAYIKEAGKGFQKKALQGKNSAQLKYEAISEQIIAVRAVIRAVEEYNLGDLYPTGSLQNRVQQLKKQRLAKKKQRLEKKKQRLEKKELSALLKDQKQHQHQQPNKRPRPSDSSATVLRPHPHSQIQPQPGPVNSAPTVLPRLPHSENRPQLGLVNPSAFMGLGSSYGSAAAPPFYVLGNPIGLVGSLGPLPFGGYPGSGFPPYNQQPYP